MNRQGIDGAKQNKVTNRQGPLVAKKDKDKVAKAIENTNTNEEVDQKYKEAKENTDADEEAKENKEAK